MAHEFETNRVRAMIDRRAQTRVRRETRGDSPFGNAVRALFRDRVATAGLVVLVLFVSAALLANLLTNYDPAGMSPAERLRGPSRSHPLGTDQLGRDLLTRIVYGARTSLTVAAASVAFGATVGVLLGLIAGYYGGLVDTFTMRIMDGFMAFPGLILALGIVAVRGPGTSNVIIAIALFAVPGVSRLIRASVLAVKEEPYVDAARVAGATSWYLMFRVIFPGCLSPLLVHMSLAFAAAILAEAALAFLGLGVRPPTPSWGEMLNTGRTYLDIAPWYSVSAGAAIFLVVLALNLLGDGLRDALDPQLRAAGSGKA